MSRIEELEKKRADIKAAREKERDAQYEKDLEARIELEAEHDTIEAVDVTRFVPGQPTMALLRTPNRDEYKRYKAQVFANAQKKKGAIPLEQAQEMLGQACWVYPAPNADGRQSEAQAAMLEAFPGLLTPLAVTATALAEGKTEEEGKG